MSKGNSQDDSKDRFEDGCYSARLEGDKCIEQKNEWKHSRQKMELIEDLKYDAWNIWGMNC